MLVAEVIVGELARRIGLNTPRLVALELDPEIARYEADEEVQDLLNASPGLNLGIDFLPGSFGYDGEPPGGARRRRQGPLARRVLRQRRPLLAQPQPAASGTAHLWVIDHGAALYFHHAWAGGVDRPGAVRARSRGTRPTTCSASRPRGLGAVDEELTALVDEAVLAEVVALVPDAWLEPVPGAETPDALRAAYVAFLAARLRTRPWLPDGGGPMKLAYQYVVLRCVPRVDREEFLNVGVVLYCQAADFLDAAGTSTPTGCAPSTRRSTSTRSARRWPSSTASARATSGGERRPRAGRPAVRLPQGAAQHDAPARPGPRRPHRRPRPPARAPPRAPRRLKPR